MTPNSPNSFRAASSPSSPKLSAPTDRRTPAPAERPTSSQPLEPKWEAAIGQATD